MLCRAILLLLPVAAYAVSDRAGGVDATKMYNRCDADNGPAKWTGSCANQVSGTPINLCGAVAFPNGPPTITVTGYNVPQTLSINNDGKSVTVSITSSTPPTLTAAMSSGSLSALVGRGTNTSTTIWNLQQMHMHWGRQGKFSEGSEHFMQGQQYTAEAHFVHYNSIYGSFSGAVAAGQPDALLVVGVFLQGGGNQDDSQSIVTLANAAATATQTATTMSSPVTLSDLYDGTGSFYSYGGSLTTPGCAELVTWIVMTQVKSISTSTMQLLWKASTSPGNSAAPTVGVYGNWRPLQPIGSRTLYNSNGATAACNTPTEATFNCNKAAESSSAMSAYQSIGLLVAIAVSVSFGLSL